MQKSKYKVIYSLRIHLLLQERGFKVLTEMKNPQNPGLNCWVYERTPQLFDTLDELLGGGSSGRK